MSIYSKSKGLHDSTIYKRDMRFIKTADIPGNIRELLEEYDEVDDTDLPHTAPTKPCIFCQKGTRLSRVVNQQALAVCQEHYYDKTIGQLAQQARLNEEAKNEKGK